MEEIWKDIPGFEGKYQINIDTPEGRCRRCFSNHMREFSAKPNKNDGRIRWALLKEGVPYVQQAAVWIALTYPELVQNEWFEGAEIDHIDTDRLNNHPSNLRWVTSSENHNNCLTKKHMSESKKGSTISEAHKYNLSKALKEKNINNPKYSKWVIKLSKNNEILHFYPSIKQAERETGVASASISKCCSGKLKNAGNFVWKFAE